MFIEFQKIRYQNLLSTGNQFTEITLNRHRNTLIMGENGAGKSTFLEAINFALYGKAFRPITKPELVNRITGKGTLVELEFRVGERDYLVRRGIKPNLFEIMQGNRLLNQDANSRDYQEMFESSILKMNQKSFSQIVVLGLANFVPFMRLTPSARREVIEDLLDIRIFSVMNTLLREKMTSNKEALQENSSALQLNEAKREMHLRHLEEMSRNYEEMIEQKGSYVIQLEKETAALRKRLKVLDQEVESLKAREKSFGSPDLKKTKLLQYKAKIEANIEHLERELENLGKDEFCPLCKQPLPLGPHDEQDWEALLEEKRSGLVKLKNGLKDLNEDITKLDYQISFLTRVLIEKGHKETAFSSLRADLQADQRYLEAAREELSVLNAKAQQSRDTEKNLLPLLEAEKKGLEEQRAKLLEDQEVQGIAKQLLNDGGIKAQIISQYIPVLNRLINKYLTSLDLFVQFEINEQFEEKIKARHYEDRSYESFSQGEKLRIDLSLLFAWREMARLRNSMTTNLFVLDEILDSALDANGTDDFLELIKSLTYDTNTFIVSHKIDKIDEFEHVISFHKEGNFSHMREAA